LHGQCVAAPEGGVRKRKIVNTMHEWVFKETLMILRVAGFLLLNQLKMCIKCSVQFSQQAVILSHATRLV